MPPYKQLKSQVAHEEETLEAMSRDHPKARPRQRAQAVWLNMRGYVIEELAELYQVRADTVREWLRRYEARGLAGLLDRPKSGRPLRYTQAETESLETWLRQAPRHLREIENYLQETTHKRCHRNTLKSYLKKRGGVTNVIATA